MKPRRVRTWNDVMDYLNWLQAEYVQRSLPPREHALIQRLRVNRQRMWDTYERMVRRKRTERKRKLAPKPVGDEFYAELDKIIQPGNPYVMNERERQRQEMMEDLFKRQSDTIDYLNECAIGKRALPDAAACKQLALKLGNAKWRKERGTDNLRNA